MMPNYYNAYNAGMGIGYGHAGFFSAWMVLAHAILWILLVWALVIFIRSYYAHCKHGCHSGHKGMHKFREDDKAMAILKEQYASGKMSKEEFLEKKKELS